MKRTDIKIFYLLLLVSAIVCSCRTPEIITLTPDQQNVKIVDGNQATTLHLMYTHTPIKTETVYSEIQARDKAVSLQADCAQLIYVETNFVTRLTFRFWKRK
jgi:hypothetical protein